MRRYLLTSQAVADLNEIHDFIAKDKPKTALQFINVIEKKCQIIAESPRIGRLREELAPGLRSFPEQNHVIFYRPIKDGIEVIRVLHGSRDLGVIFRDKNMFSAP